MRLSCKQATNWRPDLWKPHMFRTRPLLSLWTSSFNPHQLLPVLADWHFIWSCLPLTIISLLSNKMFLRFYLSKLDHTSHLSHPLHWKSSGSFMLVHSAPLPPLQWSTLIPVTHRVLLEVKAPQGLCTSCCEALTALLPFSACSSCRSHYTSSTTHFIGVLFLPITSQCNPLYLTSFC